jgi:hypothetical protein
MVCALVVLAFSVGLAMSEEFFVAIKKVEDGKITAAKVKKGEKPGDDMTYTLAENVKVVKGKFNPEEKKFEAGEALEDGLKNKRFEKIGKFGVFAQIITKDDKVTEIRVMEFKFKKKKKDE